jgi:hypothetical protein
MGWSVVGRPAQEPEEAVSASARLYAWLLALYPAGYRREYGALMAQLFRDLLRDTRQQGGWAVTRLWLRVAAELGITAGREHVAEIERFIMEANARTGRSFDPAAVTGLLFAAVVIAGGLIAKIVILEMGGTMALATGLAVTLNVSAAFIMERAIRGRGLVLLSVSLLIAASLLPLLWVTDADAWLRENPINAFIVILAAAWSTQGRPRWPILAVAGILGAAQIAISFI